MTGATKSRPAVRIALRPHHRLQPTLIQLSYIVVALAVAFAASNLTAGPTVAGTAARQALFAIAAGMVPFVAVLFSLLFLVVQWAHTQLSRHA